MQTANNKLKEAALLSLQQDYLRCAQEDWGAFAGEPLPQPDIAELAGRITALPLEYRSILFFRYCFGCSPTETEAVLQTAMAVGKLRYLRELLSESMGLSGVLVDDKAMRTACACALERETDADAAENILPHYSTRFRNKLKQIQAAQAIPATLLRYAKRAAAIFLICAIGFSSALVASAELRERFLGWVVQTFPQYSVFSPQIDREISSAEIEISYLPNGFELDEKIALNQTNIYEYKNAAGARLTISISGSDKASFAMNTENATIYPIEMGSGDAFWWDKDGIVFLMWLQDGFACDIVADLEIEQVLEVAKNIKIK